MSNAVQELRNELQIYLVLSIDLQTRLCYQQPMTDIAIKVLDQTKKVDDLCDEAMRQLASVNMSIDTITMIQADYIQLPTTKENVMVWQEATIKQFSEWSRELDIQGTLLKAKLACQPRFDVAAKPSVN